MAPTLAPGDWLLVDPLAYHERPPAPGELVVAHDPRQPERWLVKRVAAVAPDGRLLLAGDHPAHGPDHDPLPPLTTDALLGRPWLRYWPPKRAGRIR